MHEPRDFEDGWPCQRIRLAIGAFLFVAFELGIARQLPRVMVYLILALGIVCAVSAWDSLRTYRLKQSLKILKNAFAERH